MNKIKSLLIAAIVAGLFAAPAPAAQAAAPDSPAAALARVEALNNQVEQANGKLDAANRKLVEDQKLVAELNVQIAAVARLQYKRPELVVQFFEATSVSQVLADISSDQLMAAKQRNLLLQARELRKRDLQAREDAASSLATLNASQAEAQKLADDAVAAQNAYLRARALAIAASAAAQVTGPSTSQPAPYVGSGPYPNHFAYGYCTWYVANKRYIPWFGNAIDWWPNARAYGRAEGQLPQVGAVMVTRESGYGHVAYVESVNLDGSWTVSEMNFTGWNQVSRRTIHFGQIPLVGFIY
jgi:surface antigen